jgi:hypothetical protein
LPIFGSWTRCDDHQWIGFLWHVDNGSVTTEREMQRSKKGTGYSVVGNMTPVLFGVGHWHIGITLGGDNMSIPHLPQVRIALWDHLESTGGAGESQNVIEALAQHFQISPTERGLRDPTGNKTFDHRVHSAVAQSRRVGWLEPVEEGGRGIWKLTSAYLSDDPLAPT